MAIPTCSLGERLTAAQAFGHFCAGLEYDALPAAVAPCCLAAPTQFTRAGPPWQTEWRRTVWSWMTRSFRAQSITSLSSFPGTGGGAWCERQALSGSRRRRVRGCLPCCRRAPTGGNEPARLPSDRHHRRAGRRCGRRHAARPGCGAAARGASRSPARRDRKHCRQHGAGRHGTGMRADRAEAPAESDDRRAVQRAVQRRPRPRQEACLLRRFHAGGVR